MHVNTYRQACDSGRFVILLVYIYKFRRVYFAMENEIKRVKTVLLSMFFVYFLFRKVILGHLGLSFQDICRCIYVFEEN